MGQRIGFIGAGKMAEALIAGILRAGIAQPDEVIASDVDAARLEAVGATLGIQTTASNADVVGFATTVFLAVKPQHAREALASVGKMFDARHLVVSIMAGVRAKTLEGWLPDGVRVVRVMPNTACLVGEGASAVAPGTHATAEDQAAVLEILGAVGRAVAVDERLMDAVTGLSGSGPAYVFTVIEALADGGVAEGLPRDTALTLAAQTVLGAGKMVLDSGEHPAVLRDRVTSPAGTTAEGLATLEEWGIRAAFSQAVRAATDRSIQLGEEDA